MKKINLPTGHVALVSDRDYARVSKYKWYARVLKLTTYAQRNVRRGITQGMHRFILGLRSSNVQVDHRDHDGLNNQRSNLRKSTHKQNHQNTQVRRSNTSGFKGVTWDKRRKKWRSVIMASQRYIHLGYFSTKTDAANIYDKAARRLHGRFALTNF